jgi:hypothetical protein
MDSLPPRTSQPVRRQSALGKLFPTMTSQDEINEDSPIPTVTSHDAEECEGDDGWVTISKKTKEGSGAGAGGKYSAVDQQPSSSPQETARELTTRPNKSEHLGTGEGGPGGESEEEVVHISPAMAKTSGCIPRGFCVVS